MINNLYKDIIHDTGFVTKTDLNGKIQFINDNYIALSGYELNDIIGNTHNIFKSKDTSPLFYEDLWNTITKGNIWKGIFKNIAKDGTDFYLDTVIYPFKNEQGEILEYVSFSSDITYYIDLITFDQLTGLRNRDMLKSDLDSTKSYICAVVNIDNFSDITEFYGGFTGDDVIKETANRLKKVFKGSLIYRLQGDEFAILKQVPQNYEEQKLIDVFKYKLKSIFENTYYIDGLEILITATSGISIGDRYCLRNANLAFKDAKDRNYSYAVYKTELLEKFANFEINKEVATDIKKAIKEDQIIPYFQPIVDNKSRQIIKYEALARLIKNNKIVSPVSFIDISKKIKYYHKITRAILKKSFHTINQLNGLGISINITIEDIANIRTFNLIIELLSKNENNQNITFELVETEGIEDDVLFHKFVDTIKSYGAKISIDDFGTGYSNFSYLARLEPDFLKIDGSLIRNIENKKDFDVVQTVVEFAKMYNIKTVAEFVENETIHGLVQKLGIDYSQGYYFSKPLAIDEIL